jgi:signal transduction histidine kinase
LFFVMMLAFEKRAAGDVVFTNAQQVLALTPSEAGQAKLVRLRGVVTHFHTGYGWFWMQDDTAPILISPAEHGLRCQPGQAVEIAGETDLGLFAPWVVRAQVRVTGTAPLPLPLQPSPWRMAAGAHLGRRVTTEGVVRDASYSYGALVLLVAAGGAHFRVMVPDGLARPPTPDWLGARVRATGINWTDADSAGRPGGFSVRLNGTNDLVVLAHGRADVFARELSTAAAVASFSGEPDTSVRVIGTVLARLPGGIVFLQDSTGALMVEPLTPLARVDLAGTHLDLPPSIPVTPGAHVEVVGTPARAVGYPLLEDALYRVTEPLAQAALPEPVRVNVAKLLDGRHTCELVTLRGRLLRRESRSVGRFLHETLLLQSGETLFAAVLESDGSAALPDLPKDHLIEATGLATVCPTGLEQERVISLWLRGSNDVRDLGPAPREWSRATQQLLGAALFLVLAALGWIWLLRRRVSQRTHELQQANLRLEDNEARLRTVLAREKELNTLKSNFVQIVSHEFRTPLGVILSSADLLDVYLDKLEERERRETVASIQKATRQMASLMENVLVLSKADAGKMDFLPTRIDFPDFCRRLTDELLAATNHKCPILLAGMGLNGGAWGDERLLRHIFLNLLSNAVKYSAEGRPVHFTLTNEAGAAVCQIRDEGIGIPTADQARLFSAFHRGRNVEHVAGTGLGLLIVKRCIELHGGRIACESNEGSGTTFTVWLPLYDGGASHH